MRIIKCKAGWLVNGAVICITLTDAVELLQETAARVYDASCPLLPQKFDTASWAGGFGRN